MDHIKSFSEYMLAYRVPGGREEALETPLSLWSPSSNAQNYENQFLTYEHCTG